MTIRSGHMPPSSWWVSKLFMPHTWGGPLPRYWQLLHHSQDFFFFFLGSHHQHMEVSRLGVKLELELQATATATARALRDLSQACNLYHSSQQRQIPDALSKARDRTCLGASCKMDTIVEFISTAPQGELQSVGLKGPRSLQ